MKRKQFLKGVSQLSQEGAIQTFKRPHIGREEMIAGVVGVLQMDVLEYRLKSEYGVNIIRESPALPVRTLGGVNPQARGKAAPHLSTTQLGVDRHGRDVLLFENEWSIRLAGENNEGLVLAETAGTNRPPAHQSRMDQPPGTNRRGCRSRQGKGSRMDQKPNRAAKPPGQRPPMDQPPEPGEAIPVKRPGWTAPPAGSLARCFAPGSGQKPGLGIWAKGRSAPYRPGRRAAAARATTTRCGKGS